VDIGRISGDALDLSIRLHRDLGYLGLTKQPVGLLINFGRSTLREGFRRVVNDYEAVT
jgi:hypothetical protein